MDKEEFGTGHRYRAPFRHPLVAGFTLAAGPVSADAIITDASGLDAGEVSIPVSDGKIPGLPGAPAGQGATAVVLVVQEVFGVHEHIKDICRRFAKLGAYADRAVALCALWRSRKIRHGHPAGLDDRHRLESARPRSDVRSRQHGRLCGR